MSRVRVKICGLTLPEHAVACVEDGVEMIGLVFWERSKRHVSVEQARRVTAALPPRTAPPAVTLTPGPGLWFEGCAAAVERLIDAGQGRPLVVGVFADQPVSLMNSIAEAADLDLIQLGGDEPWEMAFQLRRPAIKTLRVGGDSNAAGLLASVETGTASLLLMDAAVPGLPGGAGVRADWDVAADLARSLPVMLAGGLNPDNVPEAVARVQPWAVDVSSGVERDGVKDVVLIDAFVRAARSAGDGTSRDATGAPVARS